MKGVFDASGTLTSVGIQCALCHSTVDDSFAPGVGHPRRLDGWANRDLNVGAIVALAPDLQRLRRRSSASPATLSEPCCSSWGPGKFDAEVFLDGKAVNPAISNGVVTAERPRTLIPPAFGLAGVNLHTWTGWGSCRTGTPSSRTSRCTAQGDFFDPRLDNAAQFPIAAANGFGDVPHIDPDDDQITSKLPALQFYQLAIPHRSRRQDSFDAAAAARGESCSAARRVATLPCRTAVDRAGLEPAYADRGVRRPVSSESVTGSSLSHVTNRRDFHAHERRLLP